eukprot:7478322-Heterocapsa_arctica.AAC.1
MVVDNPLATQRRVGSWAAARQTIQAAEAIAATATSKAPGTRPTSPAPSSVSRPASSSGASRKARRVDVFPGAGHGT